MTRLCAVLIAIILTIVAVWILMLEDTITYEPASLLRNKSVSVQFLVESSKFPRIVCQTYKNWHTVPSHVHEQFARFAPGFLRRFYDDRSAAAYINSYYPRRVQVAYSKLRGAHKADLFRYCYLYREGGVYLDIKTVLHKPLEEIVSLVEKHNCNMATCLTEPVILFPLSAQVYQGFLIAKPGFALFLECIEYAVQYWWRTYLDYLNFIRNITTRLLVANTSTLSPGVSNNGDVYFFREIVSYVSCHQNFGLNMPLLTRSRKTFNCSIIASPEGDVLMGTRFPDYPWQ
uniref:Glycosyltransferase n=1 Tax=viral metagenome TaxID=1070528 RepID=A0A6C0C250_9ZZZZ